MIVNFQCKAPRTCFLNKTHHTGADFCFCAQTTIDLLGSAQSVLQLPIGAEVDFRRVFNLVTMEVVAWKGDDLGASFDRIPLDGRNDIPLVDD